MRVGGRDPAKLEGIVIASGSDSGDGVSNPRWLVPLSPERNGREIWRVGFNQQLVSRHEPEQCDVSPLLECHDSAERHVPARRNRVLRERVRPGVAVQDAEHSGRARLPDERAGIVLCLPRVNHDGPVHLRGEGYLSGKRGALRIPRRVVVVVIEATLPHRDGGTEKLTQPGNVALLVESGCIVRMHARGREDKARILCRVFSRERGRR